MHSTPDRSNKNDKRTRAEQYGERHPYTCLPELEWGGHLSALFLDTGMVSQGGMGVAPLTWGELSAFEQCNRLGLTAWENQRLMAMSRAYCKWHSKGGRQGDMADEVPYIEDTDETRHNVGSQVLSERQRSQKNLDDAEGPV